MVSGSLHIKYSCLIPVIVLCTKAWFMFSSFLDRFLILVSTLDGKLSALDALDHGRLHWSVSTDPRPLLSSSISNLEVCFVKTCSPIFFYLNIIIINMIFVCLSIKGVRTIKKNCAFKHWSIDYICITPWKNSPVIKCSVFLFY